MAPKSSEVPPNSSLLTKKRRNLSLRLSQFSDQPWLLILLPATLTTVISLFLSPSLSMPKLFRNFDEFHYHRSFLSRRKRFKPYRKHLLFPRRTSPSTARKILYSYAIRNSSTTAFTSRIIQFHSSNISSFRRQI